MVFDTHADTPQRLFFDHFDLAKRDAEGCVDIPRLREGGVGAIFLALWVPVEITGGAATRRAQGLLDATLKQIEIHGDDLTFGFLSRRGQVLKARSKNKIAVLLGIEGGHAIDNSLAVLRGFHARGVRYMTLTHNAATEWADSSNDAARVTTVLRTSADKQDPGNEPVWDLLIDISHVSDATFYNVLEASRAPVIDSHSCCRALCDSQRNLDDSMIEALASDGGVMDITFHDSFLSQNYATCGSRAPGIRKSRLTNTRSQ